MAATRDSASLASAPFARGLNEPSKNDDCALSESEQQELITSLDLVKGERSRHSSSPHRILEKLITNRSDPLTSEQEIVADRELLPERFKGRLVADEDITNNASYRRASKIAEKVFDQHRIKHRSLLIYRSETPLLATWKTHFVLVSTKAVELLSEAELAGQIAHEVAHLYFLNELKKALDRNDYPAARIIELRCDLLAMVTLKLMKLDVRAVFSGLSTMTSWLVAHNQIKSVPTHPSLCARQKLLAGFQSKI